MHALIILMILVVYPLIGWAAAPQHQKSNSQKFNKNYTLDLKGCPITFKSLAGGWTALNPAENQVGYYSHENFKNNFSIDHFEINCTEQAARKVCPDLLKVDENGSLPLSNQKVQREYKNVNPHYEGQVLDVISMSMKPPRARQVLFCFGDGNRTLSGYSWVGNEYHHHVGDVLRILASIRFTDALQMTPNR